MIRSLSLTNFKAFEKFRVGFKEDAYLVGPNNAGKSTVIAALRSVANMVRIATREQTRGSLEVAGFSQAGYWFSSSQVGLIDENLRHEFHQVETRVSAKFENGTRLEAIWPVDEDDGFFFVLDGSGVNLTTRQANLKRLPTVGAVPVLSPLEH